MACTSGKKEYLITGKTTVSFSGTIKKTSKTTIPATVKFGNRTYRVTAIAGSAFNKNSYVKSIKIGKNVTSIGREAFYKCTKLKSIVSVKLYAYL